MKRAPKVVHSSPEDTEQAFYDALDAGDLDALMALWADDDEIMCIHPGGPRLVGHAAIRESWRQIFTGGGLHIRPVEIKVVEGMAVAVHNLVEQLVVRQGRTDPHVVTVMATNVYFKGPDGWKMVLHHASPPNVDGEGEATEEGDEDFDMGEAGPTLH